jgi:acetyltransferase-like isoleucine patch superfamily enzyme
MIPLLKRLFRRDNARFTAPGVYLDHTVQITGMDWVDLEEGVVIGEHSWLNVNHRAGNRKVISIGRFTFVGRRAFFTSGTEITVGPYCVLGPECHFLGAAHTFADPFKPYLVSGVTENGVIQIGANCFLGARTTFLPDCRVGFGSVVGAAAVVRGTIPPLSLAVGNPARVIKRYDTRAGRWVDADTLPPDAVFPSEEEYVAVLAKQDGQCRRHSKGARIAASSSLGNL